MSGMKAEVVVGRNDDGSSKTRSMSFDGPTLGGYCGCGGPACGSKRGKSGLSAKSARSKSDKKAGKNADASS